MAFLEQYDPQLIEAFAKLAASLFAILSGLAAGIWAVVRFLDDRKKERDLREDLERKRLEQQRTDEQGRRAERVASLMSEFGKTKDQEIRVWTTLALSLYPEETTRLLTMSLGQFDDETAKGIQLALVGIGKPAIPELIKQNKIAQLFNEEEDEGESVSRKSLYDLAKLLTRTQDTILHLIRHLDIDVLKEYDLSGLDFSGCDFQSIVFSDLKLRKCRLDGASFKRARLEKFVLRGASVERAVFTRASLKGADFTGAEGKITAIKSLLEDACLDHAKIQESNFDGANLRRASFAHTHLDRSSLNGAQLHGCRLERSSLNKVTAKKIKAVKMQSVGSIFAGADLTEGNIGSSVFERCKMMGMAATNIRASKTHFLNCHLGGTDFSKAILAGAEFRGCILGGADFRGCDLSDCVFHKCEMETATFDENFSPEIQA